MTRSQNILKTGLSVFALTAALGVVGNVDWSVQTGLTFGAVQAESHAAGGEQNQNQAGQGGNENSGQGGNDDEVHTDDVDHDGDDEESEGRGPEYGKPEDGDKGGQPVWAGEGIPEVELGRLNVARSPEAVFERSLEEALDHIDEDVADFYNMTIDEMVFELSTNFDDTTFVDSPLQNLALMKSVLDGTSTLADEGIENDTGTLLAVFLGSASDKTVVVSTDTVIAVTTILGYPITGDAAAELAADAEAIRIAILAGHG